MQLRLILIALELASCLISSQAFSSPIDLTHTNSTPPRQAPSDIVPEGFEDLVEHYTGPVTLYLNHLELNDIDIQFNQSSKTLTFTSEGYTALIDQIQSLLKPEAHRRLKRQFKKTQKVNTDAQHPYLARSKNKVTLFFNQDELKLYLLCPPQYLKHQNSLKAQEKALSKSTYHRMTLSNHLSLDYEKRAATKHYPWALEGHLSKGDTELHYDANDNFKDYFNTLELIHYGTQYQYHAGYQEPLLFNGLISNKNFWGLTIQEKPHLINPSFYQNNSYPLFIQINQSSQVQILYQGRILYDQVLFPGQHQIQTQKFPNGAYSITIKKRDLLSNVVTESTQKFNKNTALYNSIYSGMTLSGGIHSRYFKNNGKEGSSGYLYFKNGRTFKAGDLDTFYLLNEHDHQIGIDYSKQADALQYNTYGAINQRGGVSFGGQINYTDRESSYQLDASDQLHHHHPNNTLSKQYQLTYQYHHHQTNYQMFLRHSTTESFAWNGSIHHSFKAFTFPARIALNLSYKRPHSTQVMLSLSLMNRTEHNNTQVTLNHNSEKTHPNLLVMNTWENDHLRSNQHLDMPLNIDESILNLDAQAGFPQGTLRADADGTYRQHRFNLDYTRFGFSTTAINTFEGHALTYLENPTGIIANSSAHHPTALIQFNDTSHSLKKTRFIPLSAYQRQHIHIISDTPEIGIAPHQYEAFIYPHHIHGITVNEHRICWVDFTLKTSEESTFQNIDDPDILIESNTPEYTSVRENTSLKFKQFNSNTLCDTGVTVQCKGTDIQHLGEVHCQSSRPHTTASPATSNNPSS
ncbi:MAG: hypothetical protein CMF51_05500 [Legionellales bacterium]|nr:hypothetical protein [Legionellales bacterium]